MLLAPDETEETPEVREYLVSHWFLVPLTFDEIRHCDQIRNVVRLTHPPRMGICRYVVFTTTDCNARCYYCFEKGQRRLTMTEQTARDAAAYMLRQADGGRIAIRWFGGEPLCNAGAIDIIAETLRDRGAVYEGTMVSNALLFDENMIEKAVRLWELRRVLITIDGTEQVYRRTKAFLQGGDSAYRRVLDNMDGLLRAGIAVTVNLNMDASNARDLMGLADELGKRYGGRAGFAARSELLKGYAGPIAAFDSPRQALAARRAVNERLAAWGIGEKRGLKSGLALNACMADDPRSAVILPDGRIGRCDHFGDREEVGSIHEAACDPERVAAWRELRPVEAGCRTCAVYPQCLRL